MQKRKEEQSALMARVSSLSGLAEYQVGSVVSRTLEDKPSGTVTLFAFAAGQGLSEHTAPFDALVYIVDGEAEVSIAGKSLHLKTGDMTIMPANEPHALRADQRFKMLLIMVRS
jgi:quercetin dioxygenase-like cupin family protein